MPIRLLHEGYNIDGDSIRIEIHDTSYPSDQNLSIELYDPGFILSYEAETSGYLEGPFKFSRCEIRVKVPNAIIFLILRAMVRKQEESWYVRIFINNESFWAGKVLGDECTYEDESYPIMFSLVASDGFKALEKKSGSTVANAYGGLVEWIKWMLLNTEINHVYNDDEYFLATSSHFIETGMPAGLYVTGDPLAYTRFVSDEWQQKEEDGEVVYINYLEQLRAVLTTMGCTLMMVRGCFHVFQTDQWIDAENVYLNYYSRGYSTDVPSGDDPLGYSLVAVETDLKETGKVLAGGSFSLLPEAKEVSLNFLTDLSGRIIRFYNQDIFADPISGITIGSDGGLAIRLVGTIKFVTNYFGPNSGYFNPSTFKARLRIRVGSYYLVNPNGVISWSTTAGDYVINQGLYVDYALYPLNYTVTITFNITSPAIPATGFFSISVDEDVLDANGSLAPFQLQTAFANFDIEYVNTGNDDVDTLIFFSEKTGSNSSFKINLGEIMLGDGPTSSSVTRLEIYPNGLWEPSSTWQRKQAGAPLPILQMVVARAMQMNGKVREVYDGKFYQTNADPLALVEYNGNYHVMMRGEYDAASNEWSGSYMVVDSVPVTAVDGDKGRGSLRNALNGGTGTGVDDNIGLGLIGYGMPVSRATGGISGSITNIEIAVPGFNVANTGDVVLLVNSVTGQKQELTLSSPLLASDDSIAIEETELTGTYPAGSYITIPITQLSRRLYALENVGGE